VIPEAVMAELLFGRAWRPVLTGAAATLAALGLLHGGGAATDAPADRAADAGEVLPAVDAATPAAVRAFLDFAADPLAPSEANVSHDYVVRGLRLLGDALAAAEAAAPGDSAVPARLDVLRRRADALRHGRRWSEHTRYARDAFFAAGDALGGLGARGAPAVERDVSAVWDAAGRLEVERGLIEQTDRVQRCFTAAAVALRHRASGAVAASAPSAASATWR
jgi:hypothetical protein